MNRKFYRNYAVLFGATVLLLLVWYQSAQTNIPKCKVKSPNWRGPWLLILLSLKHGGIDQESGCVKALNLVRKSPNTTKGNVILKDNRGLPNILHQVWTDDILPNEFVNYVKGLVKLNPSPEWKYYFWTHTTGRLLMERKYPSLLKLFDKSDNVQKANMIRIIAIHQFGGAYFDLDTVAVKPLKPFTNTTSCSVSPEPPEHGITKDSPVRPLWLTNNVLLCKPFHPFFDEAIRRLAKQPLDCWRSIQCSGPYFISQVYDKMRQKRETFDLLPKLESYELFQDKVAKECLNFPKRVCFGKNFVGTEIWRREMCEEWKRRGGSNRNISEKAYTYHTWFHVRTHKVTSDPKNRIRNIVPHAIFYE